MEEKKIEKNETLETLEKEGKVKTSFSKMLLICLLSIAVLICIIYGVVSSVTSKIDRSDYDVDDEGYEYVSTKDLNK